MVGVDDLGHVFRYDQIPNKSTLSALVRNTRQLTSGTTRAWPSSPNPKSYISQESTNERKSLTDQELSTLVSWNDSWENQIIHELTDRITRSAPLFDEMQPLEDVNTCLVAIAGNGAGPFSNIDKAAYITPKAVELVEHRA